MSTPIFESLNESANHLTASPEVPTHLEFDPFPEREFNPTDDEKVLAGIPVDGASVAEPLTHEVAEAFVNASDEDLEPGVPNIPEDVHNPVEENYPGDFTETDRAMLTVVYNTLVQAGPAIAKIIEVGSSLTPEVETEIKQKLGNPLVSRLIKNIIGG